MAPDWTAYNEAQGEREPRALCRTVLDEAGAGAGRQAVDLGCGAGIETRAFLEGGWRVLAVDADPATAARLAERLQGSSRAEVRAEAFEDLRLPEADLVYAGYSLPFVPPERFEETWSRIRACLRPGGWLAVDLFGDRDSWAGEPTMTFVSRDRAEALLEGLHLVSLEEEDADGPAYSGPKHWHVFHVVARAPDA